MNEIKAFVHRNRVPDVVHALAQAGFENISVVDVKGMLQALGSKEQEYSIEIGEKVITEVKLELVCDSAKTPEAIDVIRKAARTGQPKSGWIYVSKIKEAYSIEG